MASLVHRVQAAQSIIENVRKVVHSQSRIASYKQASPEYTKALETMLIHVKFSAVLKELSVYEEKFKREVMSAATEAQFEYALHELIRPIKDDLKDYRGVLEALRLPEDMPELESARVQVLSLFNVLQYNMDTFFKQGPSRVRAKEATSSEKPKDVQSLKRSMGTHEKQLLTQLLKTVEMMRDTLTDYQKYKSTGFGNELSKHPLAIDVMIDRLTSLCGATEDISSELSELKSEFESDLTPLQNALDTYAKGSYGISPGYAGEAKILSGIIKTTLKLMETLSPSSGATYGAGSRK